jgi:uncharacterized protein (DUF2141 family)
MMQGDLGRLVRLAVAGLLAVLLGAAGITTPAALAAEAHFTVQTSSSIEIGSRPTIVISGDGAQSGQLRVAVLSTLGKGKGLPKDRRVWQTNIKYTGEPVAVDGPVLRIGDYRIKVWVTAKGSTSEIKAAQGEFTVAADTAAPPVGAAFDGDMRGHHAGEGSWRALLALIVCAAAVGICVRVFRNVREFHDGAALEEKVSRGAPESVGAAAEVSEHA